MRSPRRRRSRCGSPPPVFGTHAWMRLPGGEVHDHLQDRADVDDSLDHRGDPVLARSCPGGSRSTRSGRIVDLAVAHACPASPSPGDELELAERDPAAARRRARRPSRPSGSTRPGSRRRRRWRAPRRSPCGGTDLLDATLRHHRDAVRHRERLLLVVRHVDERDPDLFLQGLQLDLQSLAELGVERARAARRAAAPPG